MRQTTERVTIRLTPVDRKLLGDAVQLSNESWRGVSHHVRNAALNWARGVLSQYRAANIRKAVLTK